MDKGWTIETLKIHFDQRFIDNDKALQKALDAAEKAVNKAEDNGEKWRANANEWRGAMNDREKAFALRTDIERIEGNVQKLQLSEATLAGKASMNSVYLSLFISLLSIGLAIVTFFFK